jgi:predicted AAA+ superfamily ATPase
MDTGYTPRIVDDQIARALRISGALLIEGPRACGKTETGRAHSHSEVRLDTDADARALAEVNPKLLLEGAVPRLIDEWQLSPGLWNHVRQAVDDRRARGQFILAGSAIPADDITRHTGAGRILRLKMRPMSLAESGHSNRTVSLAAVMAGEPVKGSRSTLTISDLCDRICVGGWPGLASLDPEGAQEVLSSYLEDLARADRVLLDGREPVRDPVRVSRLLRSYARHVATTASLATLAKDTGSDGQPLDPDTVSAYLSMLVRLHVVEEQLSWGPHLRSKDLVRKASTRHFVDPSLAAAALGAGPARLARDMNTLGLLFESLVIRDLRIYGQAIRAQVLHFRDSAGVEADAVICLPDGRYAVAEVKLAASQADQGVVSLDRLVNKLDLSKAGHLVARIVITAGEYAYTRPDGALVVPLGCLGP